MSADQPKTDRELLLDIHKDVKELITCKNDHETRIRGLESSFWKLIGLAGMVGFVSGWFGKTFGGGS